MGDIREFYHEPDKGTELSTAVVTAIAEAHDEDVLEQEWVFSKSVSQARWSVEQI